MNPKYLPRLSKPGKPEPDNRFKEYQFDGPAYTSPSYAGELALPYVSAALKSGKTLGNSWVRVLDDVPYKAVLNRVEGSSLIVDATCDFTDGGAVTITERVLQVEEFNINIDLCKSTMRTGWQAGETGTTANSKMPNALLDHVVEHLAGLVGQQVENNIWLGNTTTSGQFTGFLTATTGSIAADTSVNDVALGTGSTSIAKGNVVSYMESMIDDTSSAVLSHPNIAMYCSTKTAFFYQQALGGSGYQDDYQVNAKPMNIFGIPIYDCPGFPDDQLLLTYKDNLVFGSNAATDMASVWVNDMSPIDGSDNVRFVMKYAAGVQHSVGADITWGQLGS